jgi:hypothetical protein
MATGHVNITRVGPYRIFFGEEEWQTPPGNLHIDKRKISGNYRKYSR